MTRKAAGKDLAGLVYSHTPRIVDAHESWYRRPAVLGVLALAAVVVLNIIFW
jgi:SSS family solute:Na+ symporter